MACSKVRYDSEYEARAALTALQKKQSRTARRVPNAVYGCKECSAFHLTSHGKPQSAWLPRQERKKKSLEWITVREAAEILGVHMSAVPKMIRRGDLTPRRKRPRLNRAHVEALRDARALPTPEPVRSAPRPPEDAHEWLPAPAAAAVLGCSVVALRARARRGRVPSMLSDGRRWFRLDHLELVVRADAARKSGRVARRPVG